MLTSNGGNVKMSILGDLNDKVVFEMNDVWDINPLPALLKIKPSSRLNLEMGSLLKGKPFTLSNRFALDK